MCAVDSDQNNHQKHPLYATTVPLLTNALGEKMGKSVAGSAVWLSESKLSCFEFYQVSENFDLWHFLRTFIHLCPSIPNALFTLNQQFFLRVEDAVVSRYLHQLTKLPLSVIADCLEEHQVIFS